MEQPRAGRPRRLGGAALLLGATGLSLALSLDHLSSIELVGCGLESACDRALASPFGRLPGVGWPVAFVGAAYFAGVLAYWLAGRGAAPAAFRALVRAGAVVSLGFVAVILVEGFLCPYCLGTHVLNLAFWALVEGGRRAAGAVPAPRRAGALGAGVVGLVSLVLGVLSVALTESEAENAAAVEAWAQEASTTSQGPSGDSPGGGEPFTGRYRLGPERAAIRMVVFADYQCRDCRRIEGELMEILAARPDVSFSTKHFPLSSDCNRHAAKLGKNPHKNACWAARAAEAAGILGGDEGFFRMHGWLFEKKGGFTEAELVAALPDLGFDAARFRAAMESVDARARVEADVEEALELGIESTPVIYLNGREFREWARPGALAKAVDALAAQAPRPMEASAADRPLSALAKLVADWRAQNHIRLPPPGRGGALAPGRVPVVLWGDYLEPNTRELDGRLRRTIAALGSERFAYSFRHFPVDKACNEVPQSLHPGACLAAKAVEAAWREGEDAGRRMHAEMMAAAEPLSAPAVLAAAARVGLAPEGIERALAGGEVADAVQKDIAAARRMGIRSIPLLFIGGKLVPRWKLDGQRVPETILEEALSR